MAQFAYPKALTGLQATRWTLYLVLPDLTWVRT